MSREALDLQQLEGRVEPFLLRRMAGGPFNVIDMVPCPTWNRFDLGFKLLWLDAFHGATSEFAERIYEAHIAAFSLNDMHEPGSAGKTGIERFRTDFVALQEAMGNRGFDARQSLVPLAEDGSILNAGHRCATAIALDLPVAAVDTGLEAVEFDYRFFAKRGMVDDDLDAAAIRMVEAMPNAAVALLWPAAKGRDRETEALIGPLIYCRALSITVEAGHILLSRVYRDEPWLGPPEEDFPGIRRKLMECFSGTDALRVLIFDAPPDRDRVALKDAIRQIYGIAKSSIHITDTHSEAVELAHLLLNPSARHFLAHGRPMAFEETRRNLSCIQHYTSAHGLSPGDMVVDTGMVMGLYGLRPPSDIDAVAAAPLPPGPVEQHSDAHRDDAFGDLAQDPLRHFRYAGITFASLSEVARLKARRLAGQDREDLLRMQPLLSIQLGRAEARPLALRGTFILLRMRRRVIRILMAAGLGKPLRRLYRRLRGRDR